MTFKSHFIFYRIPAGVLTVNCQLSSLTLSSLLSSDLVYEPGWDIYEQRGRCGSTAVNFDPIEARDDGKIIS